jgi:hypothetical protein
MPAAEQPVRYGVACGAFLPGSGLALGAVRPIRDAIRDRVRALVSELTASS